MVVRLLQGLLQNAKCSLSRGSENILKIRDELLTNTIDMFKKYFNENPKCHKIASVWRIVKKRSRERPNEIHRWKQITYPTSLFDNHFFWLLKYCFYVYFDKGFCCHLWTMVGHSRSREETFLWLYLSHNLQTRSFPGSSHNSLLGLVGSSSEERNLHRKCCSCSCGPGWACRLSGWNNHWSCADQTDKRPLYVDLSNPRLWWRSWILKHVLQLFHLVWWLRNIARCTLWSDFSSRPVWESFYLDNTPPRQYMECRILAANHQYS